VESKGKRYFLGGGGGMSLNEEAYNAKNVRKSKNIQGDGYGCVELQARKKANGGAGKCPQGRSSQLARN